VDILFVVDDSAGMGGFQAGLMGNATDLFDGLEDAGADYRVGVVSTDVDTAPYTVPYCENLGGLLQSTARTPPCETPPDPWLTPTNVLNPGEAFRCIATLGEQGCGFEQPLEAMHLALSDAINPGFIRSDARLIVVLFTNEDDCSAQVKELFDDAATQYGILSSFRCFEHGIDCDGTPDNLTNCRTRPLASDGTLYPIDRYVAQLQGVKGSLDQVEVVAVAGPPEPVATGLDGDQRPIVLSSCPGLTPDAEPGIRIHEFLDAVSGDHISICGAYAGELWNWLLSRVGGGGSCRSGYQCSTVTEGNICEPM
jgi:hypothetical protein